MENNGLVPSDGNNLSLTAHQVKQQVQLIQEVMRSIMQEGQHYGKVPGCGDKPTLLKPGAEKLSLTFRLRPVINNGQDIRITELGGGHREINVYCHILNSEGTELATGIGSCSTMESKYRYRGGEKISTGKPVPKEYWNLKKDGKISEAQESIGGRGFAPGKIEGNWEICSVGEKMENPDIADVYNTVLKMAKKRAYVDGILSATAASDIFTQDLEDLPAASGAEIEPAPTKSKPAVDMPKAKQQAPKTGTPATTAFNVLDAMAQPVDSTINIWGVFFDYTVAQVGKDKKDITRYKLSPREGTQLITISKWGGLQEGLALGDVIQFNGVVVKDYKGAKQYLGEEIIVLEKAEAEEDTNA